jgi:hypothetical protein
VVLGSGERAGNRRPDRDGETRVTLRRASGSVQGASRGMLGLHGHPHLHRHLSLG